MATIKKLNPDNAVSNKVVKTTPASTLRASGAGLAAKQTMNAARFNVNQQKLDFQNAGGAVNAPRTPNAPNVAEMARMLTGIGTENGKFGVDPVGVAMAFTPELKGLGGFAKALLPKGLRISSAATRITARAGKEAESLLKQKNALYAASEAAGLESKALGSVNHIGADYFDTTRRQVDPLMDSWESSTYRRGAGETISASDKAAAAAKSTGRSVVTSVGEAPGGGRRVAYKTIPTSDEMWRSRQLETESVRASSKAADLGGRAARAAAKSKTSDALIKSEIQRRLAALRAAKKRPAPPLPKKDISSVL